MFFYDACEQAWEQIVAGNPITEEIDMMLKLSATYAARVSMEVVNDAYQAAGMAAIQRTHRMQRIVRDAMVVTQHAALSELNYESAGALFAKLGIKR